MRHEWTESDGDVCFVEGEPGQRPTRWYGGENERAAEILRLAARIREVEDESPGTGLPASRLRFILDRLHEIFPELNRLRIKASTAEFGYLEHIEGMKARIATMESENAKLQTQLDRADKQLQRESDRAYEEGIAEGRRQGEPSDW